MLDQEPGFPTAKRKAHLKSQTSERKPVAGSKRCRGYLVSFSLPDPALPPSVFVFILTGREPGTGYRQMTCSRLAFLLTVIPPQADQQPFVLSRRKHVKTQRRSYKDDNHKNYNCLDCDCSKKLPF